MTAGVVALPLVAGAQNSRPARIGWLKIQDRSETPGWLRSFVAGLQALGHDPQRSYTLIERYADGDASRLVALAGELVREGVSVIVATSQPATEAAAKVTSSVPIVGRMTDYPWPMAWPSRSASPGGTSPASIPCLSR